MNVLSLFDGISCGQVALERAGIKVDKYYASEIDKYAIQVTQKNYPNTIQLGDIQTMAIPEDIDLIIGGSPCQGFSFAGKQLNFVDPRSRLFFEYVRVLKEVRPKYFLMENVKMKKEYQDIISSYLGVEPIEINSSLVSAQNRKRLYWTNIPNILIPEDENIHLKDVLHEKSDAYIKISKKGVYKKHQNKASCLTGGANSGGNHSDMDLIGFKKPIELGHATDIKGYDSIKRIYSQYGKSPTVTTMQGGHRQPKVALNDYEYRRLTPIECERLQTLPDGYTEGVSNTQRYKALGNGWTVGVISHIFKNINKMDKELDEMMFEKCKWCKGSGDDGGGYNACPDCENTGMKGGRYAVEKFDEYVNQMMKQI